MCVVETHSSLMIEASKKHIQQGINITVCNDRYWACKVSYIKYVHEYPYS